MKKRLLFSLVLALVMAGCGNQKNVDVENMPDSNQIQQSIAEQKESDKEINVSIDSNREDIESQKEDKENTNSENENKEIAPDDKNDELNHEPEHLDGSDFESNCDPEVHILDNLKDESLVAPTLYIKGDKWPCDEQVLQDAWKEYYSYLNVIFGPIADDFSEQGLTWQMDDRTLSARINEQIPAENRIEMGIPVASEDTRQCIAGLVHETGHIWLQNNNDSVMYNTGQWLWEAHTILGERILVAEGIDEGSLPNYYDLFEYVGKDVLNGVMTDGDKANRSFSDFAASCALYYLDTALSTPGTYDYWQKVSIERVKYCAETNAPFTENDVLCEIMDRVADGKTIDGMKPSEWLFSRAVSNTKGSDGTFLSVYGNYADNLGRDIRANVYGFKRASGRETGLSGQEVEVKYYDAQNNEMGSTTVQLGEDGIVEKFQFSNGDQRLEADSFEDYSAARIVAKANIGGKEYTDTNYTIVINRDDKISATDNRMFFILINEDESINNSLSEVNVEGAYSVDDSHLENGLLILHVNQGESVKLFGKTYTKPQGSRIIPIVVE